MQNKLTLSLARSSNIADYIGTEMSRDYWIKGVILIIFPFTEL